MADDIDDLEKLLSDTSERIRGWVGDILGRERTFSNFSAVMTRALASANLLEARLAEMAPPEPAVACRAGCDRCCTNTTVATQPAFAVFATFYARVAGDGGAYRDAVARLGTETHDCPFLGEHVCTIYPVRPMVCRLYHSYDFTLCLARDYRRGPRFATSGIVTVAKGLDEGMRDLGIDHGDIALDQALRLLTSTEGVAGAWLDGGDVFASCRIGESRS